MPIISTLQTFILNYFPQETGLKMPSLKLCAILLCCSTLYAADSSVSLPATEVAVLAEAVVVAHAGSASADGNWLAMWVDRTLKGRLQGGRDIIWIQRKELPKTQNDGKLWLLFLSSLGDGSWHVQSGGNEANIQIVDSVQSPKLNEISKAIGSFGPPPPPEPPSEGLASEWIRRAARGSEESRRENKLKLLAAGDSVREDLVNWSKTGEHETAALARMMLPLLSGGPVVNDVRLVMEPTVLPLCIGEMRNLTVNFANLSGDDIRIVTGQSAWGENLLASGAYELRPAEAAGKAPAANIPAVLPQNYGRPKTAGSAPLPLVGVAPAMSMLPIAVGIELEKITLDGKDQIRLKFPHGHFIIPGPGKYILRAKFAGPGPRPDQQRLIDQHYWGGGQLVSNEIVLQIK